MGITTVENKTKQNETKRCFLAAETQCTNNSAWPVSLYSTTPLSFCSPCPLGETQFFLSSLCTAGHALSNSLFMYPICRMQSSVIDLKLSFLGTHRAFRICFSNLLEMCRLPPYGEHLLRCYWLCTLLFRRHAALCTQNCFGFELLPWCKVFDDTGNITIPNKCDINMKYAFTPSCNSMSKEETNYFT